MTTHTTFDSPLGLMLVITDGRAITGLYFAGQKYGPAAGACGPETRHNALLIEATRQLGEYFDGARDRFDLPLDLAGTPFQRRVWAALSAIPYGQTVPYGTIAARIQTDTAVRAVGAAVGRNPVSIVVPCHRVVGADGSLTGYAGGVDRKRALLALEGGHARLELEPQR